jgi:hypothetical protein
MVIFDNASGPNGYSPGTTLQGNQHVQIVSLVCALSCYNKDNAKFWQGDFRNSPSKCPLKKDCPDDILQLTDVDKKVTKEFLESCLSFLTPIVIEISIIQL